MRLVGFWFEYAALRVGETLLRFLPWEAASALGAAAGSATPWLLPRRWRLALANLEAAFPEKPAAERERIARAALSNTGRVATELLKSRNESRERMMAHVRWENLELLEETLAKGKGVLFNCGHMGNWETTGVSLTAHGKPLGVVGRRIKNPYVDAWLKETRCRFGLQLISHKSPFFPSVKWLKSGNIVAILIDHNIPKGGQFVPFFGRPAATSTLTALLAVRLGAPVLSVSIRRDGSEMSCRLHGPTWADPQADPDAEIARLTVEFSNQLEAIVRERPEDWLWGHNRWKRAPEAKEAVAV